MENSSPFHWLTILISGALYPLGMAPFNFWPAVLISLTVLFASLKTTHSAKQNFTKSLVFGFGIFISGASWIYVSIHEYGFLAAPIAAFATVLFCLFMSILFASTFLLFSFMPNKQASYLFGLPSIFILSECFRSWAFTGFPWLYAGYSHTETWLNGWAPVGGVMLVSYLLALISSFSAQIWRERQNKSLKVNFLLLVLLISLGGFFLQQVKWSSSNGEMIDVVIIQPNINQNDKWSSDKRTQILKQLKDQTTPYLGKDLIIWPEAALPNIPQNLSSFLAEMATALELSQTALLTGAITYDSNTGEYFNSVISIEDMTSKYDKFHLVPFGEYVPLENFLRGLIKFFDLPMSSISSRKDKRLFFNVSKNKISPNICYEVVYANSVARNSRGSNIILTVSNDAWFGKSIGPKQHMQMARMRAIENSKPLLRATNNGISGLVSHKGVLTNMAPQFTRSELVVSVAGQVGETPFSRLQSTPIFIISIITCVILLWQKLKLRSHQ